MYNLLIIAEENGWDKGIYEIEKSRFLEYTNSEIADKFINNVQENLEIIIKYPCLFAYEKFLKANAKVGFIKKITSIDKSYRIEFEFLNDVREIQQTEIDEISMFLDIRSWEENRTHWAIKDEDLFERLKIIGIDYQFKSSIQKMQVDKKKKLPKINTTVGFINKVFEINSGFGQEFEIFYRGHSDKDRFKLEPSLFRKDGNGNYKYLLDENVMYSEIILSNPQDFSTDMNTLEKLVRMQHYSLPTRLLDITSNPLIALYFACSSNNELEGEVIVFSVKKNIIKYFDSDTASCISNLTRLTSPEKKNISFDVTNFHDQEVVKRLMHYIREEKPYFQERMIPTDLAKVLCIKSKKSNSRIVSQAGAFFLFGQDAIMEENGSEDIVIHRISIGNKLILLKELDALNINESTVFPNIESSAKYIASKHEFKV